VPARAQTEPFGRAGSERAKSLSPHDKSRPLIWPCTRRRVVPPGPRNLLLLPLTAALAEVLFGGRVDLLCEDLVRRADEIMA
jgi:hypothetical protein